MRVDFQWEVMKFILQEKEGKPYLPLLDSAVFDLPEVQLIFDLVKSYTESYNAVPTKVTLLEFFDRVSEKNNLKGEVYQKIEDGILRCFQPFEEKSQLIKDTLIEYAQLKKTKAMIREYSPRLKEGVDVFKKMRREMEEIVSLTDRGIKAEPSKSQGLLTDHEEPVGITEQGHPTYLKALNRMTAARGFHTPQLIVLMGAPKSFKTGNALKLAVEYARDGLKVYYVDNENGKASIRARLRQTLLECTREELKEPEMKKALDEVVVRFGALGGEVKFDFYPAHTKSAADVDMELERLKEEEDWIPDLILWDYPDLMVAIDPKKRAEKRINIQHVYFDIINLNAKWNVFSIALSQVNKNAVDKAVINMKDFAEDFGKAMNCHAAFALCATPEEQELGMVRIIPVVQREGVQYNGKHVCVIRMEQDRMKIEEVDYERAARDISSKSTRKPIRKKAVSDE